MTGTITDRVSIYSGQYNHAPEPTSFTCTHCGEKFTGKTALQKLRNHLGWCPKRVLLRHLKYQEYVFILTLNPRAKLRTVLSGFVSEKDIVDDPPLMVGALMILKKLKHIRDFNPVEIKNSPDFLKLPNGILSYRSILNSLSPEDKNQFGAFAVNVHENRFKED